MCARARACVCVRARARVCVICVVCACIRACLCTRMCNCTCTHAERAGVPALVPPHGGLLQRGTARAVWRLHGSRHRRGQDLSRGALQRPLLHV